MASQFQSDHVTDNEVPFLKAQVQTLSQQISELKQQLDFVMSIIGITESYPLPSAGNASTMSAGLSYAAVAAAPLAAPTLSAPIRNAIISAVHTDLHLKQSRSHNIVVTGLPCNSDLADQELFAALCLLEFGIKPDIVRVKRLGDQRPDGPDRPQPLLVILRSEADAAQLLARAKELRHSTDVYTSSSVFFAPHQTRAERQAAYEARCRRRQQTAARQQGGSSSAGPRGPRAGLDAPTVADAAADARNSGYALGRSGRGGPMPGKPIPNPAAAAAAIEADSESDSESDMTVDNSNTDLSTKLRYIAASFKPSSQSAAPSLPAAAAIGGSSVASVVSGPAPVPATASNAASLSA